MATEMGFRVRVSGVAEKGTSLTQTVRLLKALVTTEKKTLHCQWLIFWIALRPVNRDTMLFQFNKSLCP
jgi:hypothetical protein